MFKSLTLFLRKRVIKKALQQNRLLQMPDLDKFPVMSLLLDDIQKKGIKELDSCIKDLFNPKRIRYIVLCDNNIPQDVIQSDTMIFITKQNFNFLGVLCQEKEEYLKMSSDDIFVNLSDNNDAILLDYLVSFIKSSLKIGHSKNNSIFNDLTIDFAIEKSNVERMKIIHKYLLMLSGKNGKK